MYGIIIPKGALCNLIIGSLEVGHDGIFNAYTARSLWYCTRQFSFAHCYILHSNSPCGVIKETRSCQSTEYYIPILTHMLHNFSRYYPLDNVCGLNKKSQPVLLTRCRHSKWMKLMYFKHRKTIKYAIYIWIGPANIYEELQFRYRHA